MLTDDELDRVDEILESELQTVNLMGFLMSLSDFDAVDGVLDEVMALIDGHQEFGNAEMLLISLSLMRIMRQASLELTADLWETMKGNPKLLAHFEEMLVSEPDDEPDRASGSNVIQFPGK